MEREFEEIMLAEGVGAEAELVFEYEGQLRGTSILLFLDSAFFMIVGTILGEVRFPLIFLH